MLPLDERTRRAWEAGERLQAGNWKFTHDQVVELVTAAMAYGGAKNAAAQRRRFQDHEDHIGETIRDRVERGCLVIGIAEDGDVAVWDYCVFNRDPNGSRAIAIDGDPVAALYEAARR